MVNMLSSMAPPMAKLQAIIPLIMENLRAVGINLLLLFQGQPTRERCKKLIKIEEWNDKTSTLPP